MHPELRPMDLGELLDRSIQLFRQSWRPLLLLGLIAILPTLIHNLLVPVPPESTRTEFLASIMNQQVEASTPLVRLLHFVADGLVGLLVDGAIILIATQALLGKALNLGEAVRSSARHLGRLVSTSMLAALALIPALFGLVVVGLIIRTPFIMVPLIVVVVLGIFLLFSFRQQVIMSEEWEGSRHALGRSVALVKSRLWPIAGFSLLFGLGALLLDLCLRLFLNLPLTLLPVETAGLLRGIVEALPPILTDPFGTLVMTLLYLDTRIRQEGLDLTQSQDA